MEICTAVVASIAQTGADAVIAWMLVAAVVIAAGFTLVLVRRARRDRRGGATVATVALVALVALAFAAPLGAAPAHAAASDVDYSPGCTLIHVDESLTVFEPVTMSMLPGDDVIAIRTVVENRFAGDIELDAEAQLGSGPLAALLDVEVLVDGGPAPVVLTPGQRVSVEVHVALAPGVGNTVQGEAVAIDLVLTASEK